MFTFKKCNLGKQSPAPEMRYGKSEGLKTLNVCETVVTEREYIYIYIYIYIERERERVKKKKRPLKTQTLGKI